MGKFLLVAVVFAALVYTAFWLIERRRAGAPAPRRTTPKPAPRSVAPDDDEEFLRGLNRRNPRPDQGREKPGD